MIRLISTGSYIVFLDPKFYRHEYTTKVEYHKNSQNFDISTSINTLAKLVDLGILKL